MWAEEEAIYVILITISMDVMRFLDSLLVRKLSKGHFLKDIENSFQEVTHIGLEPHQFFLTSTNTVTRDVESFGQNGPWQAGCLSYGQNFFVKFAQTYDEQI